MKIPDQFKESKRNQRFRESHPMCVAYKLLDLDDLREKHDPSIIDVRVFQKNNSQTCRAVIWIHDKKGKRYSWGVGITSGCGYHHESEAIEDAFRDMGIKFESGESFGSTGTTA